MSIQSEIERIESNIADTYSELEEQGADMPSARNSANLAATAATTKTVKYIAQSLTAAQKAQARANINASGHFYGVCSTAAATAAKTVTVDSSFSLTEGAQVTVRFTYANSIASPTLNVNGTGAKPIYYRGAAITNGVIKAGDIATFIYSTNYHLISVDNTIYPLHTETDRDIYVDALGIKRYTDATYAEANSAIMDALMTKLDSENKNGYTIHFGSGHYYFANPIVSAQHIAFKGAVSNACNIEDAVNYGSYLHFPNLADGEAGITMVGGVVQDLGIIGNPSVCDVNINRNEDATPPTPIITLTDEGKTYGIRYDANWGGVTVQNVKVMNCTYGIFTPTGNGLISGFTAEKCKIGVSVGNDMKITDIQVWNVMVGVDLRGQLASATNIRGDSIGKHLIVCRKGKCLLTNIDGDCCVGSLIHYGLCGDGYDADDSVNKYIHLGQAVACMGRVATKCLYGRSTGFDLANVADADYDSCSYISIAPDLQVFGGQIDIVNVAANPLDVSSEYLHPNAAISIGTGSTVKGVVIRCNIPLNSDAAYFNKNVIKNLSTYAEATNDTTSYLTDFDGVTVEDICFITPSGFLRSVRTTSALDRQIIGSEDVAVLSKKVAQIEEVIEPMEVLVPGINLNDGVYEYGRFAAAGTEYADNTAFRNANYLPVEGGRTIAVYFDKYEWNNNDAGRYVYVVEYDADKNIIGQRNQFNGYASNSTFTLNANTAFVRLSIYRQATISTPLTDIKMALYYIEDARKEFVEYGYGAEYTYGVKGSKVSLVSPNGTTYVLSVSDDGILSAVLPVQE